MLHPYRLTGTITSTGGAEGGTESGSAIVFCLMQHDRTLTEADPLGGVVVSCFLKMCQKDGVSGLKRQPSYVSETDNAVLKGPVL